MSQYIEEVNERNFDRIVAVAGPGPGRLLGGVGLALPDAWAIVEAVAARGDSAFRQA
jgi:hypothetical protein